MSATYGRTSPKQFAFYDHATSIWKTYAVISLWGSDEYLETWPKSGTTRNGRAYERPTSEHPTDANGSSSLLPTPVVTDSAGTRNSTARRRDDSTGHIGDTLTDAIWKMHGAPDWAKTTLLPTPTARDWKDGKPCEAVAENALLGRAVWSIGESTRPPCTDGNTPSDDPLPTPPTTKGDSTPSLWNGCKDYPKGG